MRVQALSPARLAVKICSVQKGGGDPRLSHQAPLWRKNKSGTCRAERPSGNRLFSPSNLLCSHIATARPDLSLPSDLPRPTAYLISSRADSGTGNPLGPALSHTDCLLSPPTGAPVWPWRAPNLLLACGDRVLTAPLRPLRSANGAPLTAVPAALATTTMTKNKSKNTRRGQMAHQRPRVAVCPA